MGALKQTSKQLKNKLSMYNYDICDPFADHISKAYCLENIIRVVQLL